MIHLEEKIQFHYGQEQRAHQQSQNFYERLNHHKKQQLHSDGCRCNSTYISINGTKSRHTEYMGTYHFEGMFKVSEL